MKLTIVAVLMCCVVSSASIAQQRTIAFTIDDLPVVSTRGDLKNRQEITRKLLGHLKKARVPAVGFVNENKLYNHGRIDEQQVDLLRMWLDAGFELGNHSFSHRSLNQVARTEYEADVLKGETITKGLLAKHGMTMRYFRHPFLQTGRTAEVKTEFAKFLAVHGYIVAPITFDNADYIFSRAYDLAYDRGDKKLLKRIGDAYVPYMDAKAAYWERQSVKLFGREIPQTYLLHANFINSDYVDDLAAMFKRRGYRFVDLETALRDSAYRTPDDFMGAAGISWLHRWAVERGSENVLPDEPKVPEFVMQVSGFTSE